MEKMLNFSTFIPFWPLDLSIVQLWGTDVWSKELRFDGALS